jgi:hypothetical protein
MLLMLSAMAKSVRLGLQRAYGVPRATLQDRLHGATGHSMASETTQKLTSEQEKCLVKWIEDLETQGKAPSLPWSERWLAKL